MAPKIVSLLPKSGRIYCEPFCGRGNIFWCAVSQGITYEKWWLNDTITIPYFRAIKEIGNTIEVPECSRSEYEKHREAFKSGDQTATLLEPFLTFGGNGYLYSGFRGTRKGGVSSSGYQRTLRGCHRIIQRTRPRLSSLDWETMGLEKLGPQDVVVIDAPYPDTEVAAYTDETVDYVALVDTLLSAKFRWVLCGYIHPALHRLGEPACATDVRFLYFPDKKDGRKYGEERRIECLWTNYAPDKKVKRHPLPTGLRASIRIQTDAASLSFSALDAKIDAGLQTVANDWNALVPYLLEMNRRLSAPGRRTDLRKGAPIGLTWTQWVESKRHKLHRSLRSVQRLLRGRTEASRNWKTRPHLTTACREVPGMMFQMPDSAMGIAFQMARLILEMRSRSRNTTSNKRRLERLAVHFLSIAERRSQQRGNTSFAERIGIANGTAGGVTLTM